MFFDELRLAYSYEPEGFDLGGDWYLPDFWLPVPGAWFEVKGVEPNERERRVACALSQASRCPVFIAVGAPSITEQWNLRTFINGRQSADAAFTSAGDNLFLSSMCGNVRYAIRESFRPPDGTPEPITGPARVAANHRFGVHE